jgi:hypothetical protein
VTWWHLDWWQQLGIFLATVSGALALLGWSARGLQRMWHLGRKLNRWLDQALGDKEAGLPSLMERVESIEEKLSDHLEWHGSPNAQPAKATHPRPNGGGGAQPPPRRR